MQNEKEKFKMIYQTLNSKIEILNSKSQIPNLIMLFRI